jgi:hypothetical protein
MAAHSALVRGGNAVSSDVNSAQVVVNRESAFSGALLRWTAWIDDQKAGTVANGASLTVEVTPGRHTIMIGQAGPFASRSQPLAFDAEPGARIDLVTRPSATGRPKVWLQGTPPARSGLADLLEKTTASASWRRAMDWKPKSAENSPVPSQPVTTVPAQPTGTAPRPPARITSKVLEGSRFEVAMGDETRTIDNSKSGSSTTRVVRLSREWSRTCTVDVEHATTGHGSAGLGLHLLDLKVEAEHTLRKTYSTSAEERETFEEEVTLNIGPRTRSEIVFSWKEIRQKGVVQLAGEDLDVRIPYEAVVGLTFDQQQIDG